MPIPTQEFLVSTAARTTLSISAGFLLLVVAAGQGAAVAEPGDGLPPKDAGAWTLSDQTYRMRHLPAAAIRVDGRTDDPAWSEAAVERRFQAVEPHARGRLHGGLRHA